MSHGKKLYSLKGYRRQWASSTAWNDLAPYLVGGQAQLNTPVAATTYYVVSTSAQDLTAGTGVDSVRILYLDATGYEHTVTASLNGTTAVSIGAGFSFIHFMESYHSTTADRVAAGAISITSTNGAAADGTSFEQIRAGGNRSQSCRYKVPTATRARLLDYHVSGVKLGGGSTNYDVELRATIFNDDGTISNAFHFLRGTYIADGGNFSDDIHYKEVPAGAIIKVSIIPSAIGDGNIIKADVDIEVIEDYE
jgi:hypothetical protein